MKRETVGKISQELLQKDPETNSPVELEREMHEDYDKNIFECISEHKKMFPDDFFIVVITKNERLMPNVFRNFFTARLSCPTPDYDQTVYRYAKKENRIEFLWVIPSRDACFYLKENALSVSQKEKVLLNFVLDFADGTLFKLCKNFNGEKENSPELEKGN
jgi:hypothetical protein